MTPMRKPQKIRLLKQAMSDANITITSLKPHLVPDSFLAVLATIPSMVHWKRDEGRPMELHEAYDLLWKESRRKEPLFRTEDFNPILHGREKERRYEARLKRAMNKYQKVANE